MSHSLINCTDAQPYGLAAGHRPWTSFAQSATDVSSCESGRTEKVTKRCTSTWEEKR